MWIHSYRGESTWIKVRFGAKWFGTEMVWYRNVLFTKTSCLILVKEKLYYKLLAERQNVNIAIGLKMSDLILSFIVLLKTNIGYKTFLAHNIILCYAVTF